MKKIVPAILTDDPQALAQMISAAETFCDLVQVDIMDGKFVPSKSITYEDLKAITTKLFLEVHLMVEKPEIYFQDFKDAGAKRILFHYEATDKPKELIKQLKDMGISPGIVINPETSVGSIASLLDDLDMVLVMAVVPGYYGSKFIPDVLAKTKELAGMNKNFIISLDGGVKLDNVAKIADAGVEQIDIGSAIFGGEDPAANYREFVELIK